MRPWGNRSLSNGTSSTKTQCQLKLTITCACSRRGQQHPPAGNQVGHASGAQFRIRIDLLAGGDFQPAGVEQEADHAEKRHGDDCGQGLQDNGPIRRHDDVGRLRPGSRYATEFAQQRPHDGARVPRLADVLARINEEIRRCGASDELKTIWAGNGAEFSNLTPQQFGGFVSNEVKRWAAVVKASGAKFD